MSYCYFKGSIIEEDKVSIPLTNLGVQRGFGVFDYLHARAKKPTFLDDHLYRFHYSQKFLNLSYFISKAEIKAAIAGLQQINNFENSSFRLMLLADGEDTDVVLQPFFYISNKPVPDILPLIEGQAITYEYLREYPEFKTLNYQTTCALHTQRIAAKATEIIYHKAGIISEGSRSNLFIVKDGILKTPAHNILKGITRKYVMAIAADMMTVKEVDVSIEDLFSAEEVFLSSTYKQVMPLIKINDKIINDGKVGTWTLQIRKNFLDLVSRWDV